MNRKPCLILAMLILLTSLQSYALDFFGVPIGGTIDEMTEKLKPLGFAPVKVVAKKGEFAGKEVIFGNDKIRYLKGKLGDRTIPIYLNAPQAVSVESIVYEGEFDTKRELDDFTVFLMDKISNVYGSPSDCVAKQLLTYEDTLKLKKKFGSDRIPDFIAQWKQRDGNILLYTYYSDKSIICSFKNFNEPE